MIKIIRAKMHGIKVTESDLHYHGSVTLDPELCKLVGFYPLEFVDIWNKNSGNRLSTYVIFGEAGSKCCILNGAAARTCQKGDEIIIAASEYINNPEELYKIFKTLGELNRVRIICCMIDGPKSVSQIIASTALSQPLVSFHLKALREVGLVVAQRKSTIVINKLGSPQLITLFNELRKLCADNKKV